MTQSPVLAASFLQATLHGVDFAVGRQVHCLEEIVNQVAKREFRTIERLGAVLGFIIGCIQLLLLYVTGAIA